VTAAADDEYSNDDDDDDDDVDDADGGYDSSPCPCRGRLWVALRTRGTEVLVTSQCSTYYTSPPQNTVVCLTPANNQDPRYRSVLDQYSLMVILVYQFCGQCKHIYNRIFWQKNK